MIQAEFKETFDALGRVAQRHSYSDVFQGFLSILLNYLADGGFEKERDTAMQRFSHKEKQQFNKVFYSFFDAQKRFWENNHDAKWLDVFGQFYEEIVSRSKSSAMGQFFTPPGLCDLMAMITVCESKEAKTASDCCSGSGRLILAAHAINPYLQFEAMDKDYICAMMTAINMQLHGCLGIVYWADALTLEYWKGFRIILHPVLKLPYIEPFTPKRQEIRKVAEKAKGTQPKLVAFTDPPPPPKKEPEKAKQLTLF